MAKPIIQTKQCLHCQQNKEGITFEVYIIDSEPPKYVTKHYCWKDLEDLMRKELDKSSDWERNKKKLFKEWIAKCKQRQSFEWPWREREREREREKSYKTTLFYTSRIELTCERFAR